MELKSYRASRGDALTFDKLTLTAPMSYDTDQMHKTFGLMVEMLPRLIKLAHPDPEYRKLIAQRLASIFPGGFGLSGSLQDTGIKEAFWYVLSQQPAQDFPQIAETLGSMALNFDNFRADFHRDIVFRQLEVAIIADRLMETALRPEPAPVKPACVQEGEPKKAVPSLRRTLRNARSY